MPRVNEQWQPKNKATEFGTRIEVKTGMRLKSMSRDHTPGWYNFSQKRSRASGCWRSPGVPLSAGEVRWIPPILPFDVINVSSRLPRPHLLRRDFSGYATAAAMHGRLGDWRQSAILSWRVIWRHTDGFWCDDESRHRAALARSTAVAVPAPVASRNGRANQISLARDEKYYVATWKLTRKPCCRKETARCRSGSFRFKVRRQHSLQV